MSRKRLSSILASDSPSAKRQLSAALAAELNELRIGQDAANRPHRHEPFGAVTHSPFMQPSSPVSAPAFYSEDAQHKQDAFGFGRSFGESLGFSQLQLPPSESFPSHREQGLAEKVTVTVPAGEDAHETEAEMDELQGAPTDSDMESDDGVVNIDLTGGYAHSNRLCESDDTDDMDLSQQSEESGAVVLYRPVPMSSIDMSKLRARVPNSELYMTGSADNEWMLRYHERNSVKRKLALVPWNGGAKRLAPFDAISSAAIPMPWHEEDKDQMQTC